MENVNAERWALSREHFHAMLTLSPAERAGKLAAFSPEEADIRDELIRLFGAEDVVSDFLSPEVPAPTAIGFQPAFRPGDVVDARYDVVAFLGSGGMGEVYQVRDRQTNTTIALKTLRAEIASQPALVSRLRKEMLLASRVNHPHVCRMIDFAHSDEGPLDYLTMELLAGVTLADRLRERPFSVVEADPIARQLISGLEAAHREGILHRDFKSGNVMLTPDRAVITDFGLAREQNTVETFSAFGTGAIVGTPAYMAPEQLQGKAPTVAADLHSLGAVLFEMVTGRIPFPGETPLAIALRRLQEDAPSPRKFAPSLEARWEAAILACLERDPNLRPASANHVLELLEGRAKRPFRYPSRRAVAAVLGTAGLGTVAYYAWRPKYVHPEALQSWKRAEEFVRRRTAPDLKNAVEEFERAVAVQPDFAEAWSGLANAYSAMSEFGLMETQVANQKALAAARRAIGLEPRSGRAHGVTGYIVSNDLKRWRTTEPHFRRALSHSPHDPLVRLWYASFLGKSGRSREALEHLRAGLDDDPSNFVLNQQLAAELYRAREYERCYRQVLELERLQPYEGGTHFMMARVLERRGQFEEALARCDRAVNYGLGTQLVDAMRAVIAWSQGYADAALKLAGAAEAYWRAKPMAAIHVATAYGHCGEAAKSIDILLAGCAREDASVLGADRHPLLERLHSHPRYSEFRARIGLA
jgi:tetratricopeptide (TPR) repeat protein